MTRRKALSPERPAYGNDASPVPWAAPDGIPGCEKMLSCSAKMTMYTPLIIWRSAGVRGES